MKNMKSIVLIVLCALLFTAACDKATEYRKYLDYGQNEYPGIVKNLRGYGGLYRLLLVWGPQVDPSVVKYVVYWDNGSSKDSLIYTPKEGNSGLDSVYINSLSEADIYTVTVYSYDSKGNRSVPVELQNAVVYGSIFRSNLNNRQITSYNYFYQDDTAYITWAAVDSTNADTRVTYTDNLGNTKTISVSPQTTLSKIPNINPHAKLYYQSGFVPVMNSPDTIYSDIKDSLIVDYEYSGNYTSYVTYTAYDSTKNNAHAYDQPGASFSRTITKVNDTTYQMTSISDWGNVGVMNLAIHPNNTVSITGNVNATGLISTIVNADGTSSFDPATKTFVLYYRVIYTNGDIYFEETTETLTLL